MKFKEKKQILENLNPDILLAEGFEKALIGYCRQFNKTMALYDYSKCVHILMQRDGMDLDEAEEFLEFNVLGAWVGTETPAYAFFFHPSMEVPNNEESSGGFLRWVRSTFNLSRESSRGCGTLQESGAGVCGKTLHA